MKKFFIKKRPKRKGDGWCDDDNNHNGCEFDGGDCCCGNKNYCSKCECLIQVNCLDNTTASSIISPIVTTSTNPPTALEYGIYSKFLKITGFIFHKNQYLLKIIF